MNVIKEYLKIDTKFDIPFDKLTSLYPRLKDQIMPLSVSGVSPRTFFHWKKKGIIDYEDEITRVKLNLFQYVWLQICTSLRFFGVPLSILKNLKRDLFQDMGSFIIDNKDEIFEMIKNRKIKDNDSIRFLKAFIPLLEKDYDTHTQEYRIYTSALGSIITGILLLNKEAIIAVANNGKESEFGLILYDNIEDYFERLSGFIDRPHVIIPLRPIITNFLINTNNEKYIEKFELLKPDELRVLSALRRKDFTELIIKPIRVNKGLQIEIVNTKDITDDKVLEITRILGLNQYTEVILKRRNDKHIFLRRKAKLNE